MSRYDFSEQVEPYKKAEQLVWDFYNLTEHTLSEEYSTKEWEIAKIYALKVVDEIETHMYQDDMLHECGSNANSPWVEYYNKVRNCIKEFGNNE
jgi:hypothetical protein